MSRWKDRFYRMCHEQSELAHAAYRKDVHTCQFLWFSESRDRQWGRLVCSPTCPTLLDCPLQIATQESVPPDMTLEQMTEWVTKIAEHLPLIGD